MEYGPKGESQEHIYPPTTRSVVNERGGQSRELENCKDGRKELRIKEGLGGRVGILRTYR